MSWLSVLAASTAFVALLLLPGFGVLNRLRWSGPSAVTSLMVAMAISVGLIAGIGTVALLLGAFTPAVMLVPLLAIGVLGVWPLVKAVAHRSIWLPVVVCSILSLPWAMTAVNAGHSPTHRFQWYYWGLGKELTEAKGIPGSVTELGLELRWLPDYLYFNVFSECYRGLMFMFSEANALTAWRYPVAVFGYLLFYSVCRMWVGRLPAYLGLVLLSFTAFFPRTFDVYKPESLGIIIGLVAVWLVVSGMRWSRVSLVLLGGMLVGINLGVHAIAATALGTLIIAASATEWFARSQRRPRLAATLVAAGVLALGIAMTSGTLLQGRALVAGDALNPAQASVEDPTWTYLNRSAGLFSESPVPDRWAQFTSGWETRLEGVLLFSSPWSAALVLAALGLAVIRGTRRTRIGVVSCAGGGLLLGAGILFFLVSFDTYVPRHTGAARLLGYASIYGTLAAVIAVDGVLASVRGANRPAISLSFPTWASSQVARAGGAVLLVFATLGITVGTVSAAFSSSAGLPEPGRAALEELTAIGAEGDVVLSNVGTAGIIEFFTNKENPLESRQPLIEDPTLLEHANDLLLRAHDYFSGGDDRILADLGVQWLLVADRTTMLGGGASFGGSVDRVARRLNVDPVWSSDGVAIFEVVPQEVRLERAVDFARALDADLTLATRASWTFDEASGVAALDASGNANHGRISRAEVDCAEPAPSGDADGCVLSFDGLQSAVIARPAAALDVTDEFTVSMWVKQTGIAMSQYQRLIDKSGALTIWMDDQVDRLCVRLEGTAKSTEGNQVCFRAGFLDDRWYHIAVTYDGDAEQDRLRLYVDGSRIGTSDEYSGPAGTNDAALTIGNRARGDRPFHGLLDDVRIYSRALPDGE